MAELSASAYIDGCWVTGTGAEYDIVNPTSEEVLATVSSLTVAQADEAVAAAFRAFNGGAWSTTPARERSRLLHRLADLIERDTDHLGALMIDEIGTPRAVVDAMQVPFVRTGERGPALRRREGGVLGFAEFFETEHVLWPLDPPGTSSPSH